MPEKGRVLAVIPARAGSKGLPGKNCMPLFGKPLIQWTIEAAMEVKEIDEIVVTSDDELILEIAASLGVTAHRRSAHLGGDLTQASQVIADVVTSFRDFQTIIYLQPTSPLRSQRHIYEALQIFNTGAGASVISVTEVTQPPEWMFTLGSDERLMPYMSTGEIRRQDTQPKYIPNGAIYIADINLLRQDSFIFLKPSSIAYLMNSRTSIDIDDQFDFEIAEWIMRKLNS